MHVDRFTNEKARFEFLIFRVISWIASGRQNSIYEITRSRTKNEVRLLARTNLTIDEFVKAL